MIVQNVGPTARPIFRSPCSKTTCRPRSKPLEEAAAELGAEGVAHDDDVAKVSVVGLGMATQTGVADRMFRALADAGVNIETITTSEIKISVLVDARSGAGRAAGRASASSSLDKDRRSDRVKFGEAAAHATAQRRRGHRRPAAADGRSDDRRDLARRDAGPGDARRRARSARASPPRSSKQWPRRHLRRHDRAKHRPRRARRISASPCREADLASSAAIAEKVAKQFGCGGGEQFSPKVAKISVSGIGMRSHTGVAMRMFQALAEAGINVEMISTSEVRVNVVVDGAAGQTRLACLQKTFGMT